MTAATTTTGTVEPIAARPASPAATWSGGARAAAATTLLLAGVFWFVADVIGFNVTDELPWMAAHRTLAGIGVGSDILAVPFLFGSALVWFLLSRRRSTKIATAGLVLLVLGLIGQAMIEGVEMIGYTVAQSGQINLSTYDSVTQSPAGLPGAVFMAMFFIGSFAGIVLAMIGLWRSRALPRTAAVLLVAFQIVQMAGLPIPSTGIALVGLAWMALAVLRTPRTVAA